MKRISQFVCGMLLAVTLSVLCHAALNVTVPQFAVNINGQTVSSDYRQYPLIVYNDITYFPMTYHDAQFLGLSTTWDGATSTLSVSKTESSGNYHDYLGSTLNKRNDYAERCSFNVIVNGKAIDNASEEYPLLLYRNVTYFPLTWRFGVTEFGWSYNFTSESGLVISSDGRKLPVVKPNPYASYITTIETSPSVTDNYWGIWNDALSLKDKGSYQAAIDKILSISYVFLNDNTAPSKAMLFKHLGDCHSKLGEFGKASVCYAREAHYWAMCEGQEETKKDAERRSKLICPSTEIYVATELDSKYSVYKNYGVEHEPVGGIYLGSVYETESTIGKGSAGILKYLNYGSNEKFSISDDKILQLSLQPSKGLWQVNGTDGYLEELAKSLENSGMKVILRFAGEMNDSSTLWPSTPEEYIEKFRIVADIFHKYGPSVPIIWAPNFYPTDNIEAYYPGDEYVDYVGVSLYQEYQPETDPLGEGVDRQRWLNFLDFIYTTYSDKKPIMIVEGGAAYRNNRTTKDLTDYSVTHIKEFFTYLPIVYPNVKMFFIFNRDDQHGRLFDLYNNATVANAYRSVLANNPHYYDSTEYTPNTKTYYSLDETPKVKAAVNEMYCYNYTIENNVSYVVYYIDGNSVGTSYGIPYKCSVDFTAYKGKTVNFTAKAFDATYKVVSESTVSIVVE